MTFNSVTLPFPHATEQPSERSIKEVGYPGVDYVDWMNLGKRGRMIIIRGFSPNTGDGVSKSTLDGLNDGAAYTLSVHGASYPNTLCLGFTYQAHTDTNGIGFFYTGVFRQMEA